ncbi:MAG: Rossmann-like and DUF2520 domain-containing protein [Anaerovoracaceae bacterium]|jgi:predicted short-subunit dehydrogenase-like oxidoreductase (DUF2520 family)
MKIGFVGAGKVGFTLGKYFKNKGLEVIGYYSRNRKSAREAADFTGAREYETIGQIVKDCQILFLTVPDGAIEELWRVIKNLDIQGKIICHCSGALTSEVFEGIEQRGAYGYSVHPFFAINSKLNSYKALSQAFFTIEGDEKHANLLMDLIKKMGNPAHGISSREKIKYHGAAVFLSNHVTALAHVGSKILKDCGFDDKMIQMALNTLFLNQSKSIAEKGMVESLTGPVERNDLATVHKHLECLDEKESRLYSYLSEQLIEIAREKHAGSNYSEMEVLLKKTMEK